MRSIQLDIIAFDIDDQNTARRSVTTFLAGMPLLGGPPLTTSPKFCSIGRRRSSVRWLKGETNLVLSLELMVRWMIHYEALRLFLALMAFQFKTGVSLPGEEPALLVLPIRGFREFIEDVGFGAEARQFFERGIERQRIPR